MYCQYITGEDVITKFRHIASLPNDLVVTFADRIHQLCTDLNLDLQRFCGLGSDGASLMLGNRGGVSMLLKKKVPFLVANHCVAYRLALASSQAANEIPNLEIYSISYSDIIRIHLYACLA